MKKAKNKKLAIPPLPPKGKKFLEVKGFYTNYSK